MNPREERQDEKERSVRTSLHVLSEDEKAQVHEHTLKILAGTGIRVNTAKGREILGAVGAGVDENTKIVRFPRALVEQALRSAPREFTLGSRRPGWDLPMNAGNCSLIADGEATTTIDRRSGEHRPSTFDDWLEATLLTDALDEVGVYWSMARGGEGDESIPNLVDYWKHIFGNFSKHVQDAPPRAEHAPWLLEVLQTVFGDKETIRRNHPFSFLICPESPLAIEEQHTDAYLALLGWDIPVAVMPMPTMGGTGPGNMISMTVLGNCEVLSTLCLIQAAAPGTPFIYAPVLGAMNPRTGMYSAGAIENALLASAAVEMARYYGLPAEGTGGGTDTYVPGIQAGYERALTAMMPMLCWPDLFVAAGLLGGSMILCLEQLVIDTEIFRMNEHAHRGILTAEEMWLDDVIDRVGPSGNFMAERSTAAGIRSGEWLLSGIGLHEPQIAWESSGKKDILEEAREKVEHILSTHEPLPLGEDVERELERIQERAKARIQ
jgi:trimethylamine--corrinoid protein Co-methyltransferase